MAGRASSDTIRSSGDGSTDCQSERIELIEGNNEQENGIGTSQGLDPEVIQQPRSSTDDQQPSSHDPSAKSTTGITSIPVVPHDLRYRKRYAALMAFYLPILILPWVFTCVLSVRPMSHPSYYNQTGSFGFRLYLALVSWMAAVNVLNTIASVITIPVLSCLIAQAAVVYCQRRQRAQSMNLRQTLVLADRGWLDLAALWEPIAASWSSRHYGGSSKFQWLAFGLIVVGMILRWGEA